MRARSHRFLALLLLGSAAPGAAQEEPAARWTLTVSAGPLFGGPSSAMTQHFLEEGWTEPTCTPKGTDCHPNPVRGRPLLQGSAALGRRLGKRLEAQLIAAAGSLGSASGRRGGYDVTADWSTISLGGVLALKPVEAFRVGAGPLLGVLEGETPGGVPRAVLRAGLLFEAGVRSSARKPTFVSLSASYRLLGKRWEGPWPARKETFYGVGGPSPLQANYSYFAIALGVGARF